MLIDPELLLEKYNFKGRTILIVEDDHASNFFLDEVLQMAEANVLHAYDGEEALKICKDNPSIDLILMDIQLPQMDGLSATRKIRSNKNPVPIIAQTAYVLSGEKQRCLDAGCTDFVAKPININNLFELMDKYINKTKK